MTPQHAIDSQVLTDFLFQSTDSAVCVVDCDLRVREINGSFAKGFGVGQELVQGILIGNSMGCCNSIEENKACGGTTRCAHCELKAALDRAFREDSGLPVRTYLSRKFYVHGHSERKHLRIHAQKFEHEGLTLAAIMMDDVTELEENRELIGELAELDPLTGLHTRHSLETIGETLFQNALRGNFSIAVAVMSVERLPAINAERGLAYGNRVLAWAAGTLAANTRKSDLLARFGGEEFALVMTGTRADTIGEVAAKLRSAVEKRPFEENGGSETLRLRIGLATRLEASLSAMLRKADESLRN